MSYPKVIEGHDRNDRPYKVIAVERPGCKNCIGDRDAELCHNLPSCGSSSSTRGSLQFLPYTPETLAEVAIEILEDKS